MSNTARPKTAGDKLASDEVNRNLPIEATAGETISVASNPIPVYIKDTDGECYKTDASFDDERIHNFVGFAMTAGSDGNAFTLQTHGVVIGFTGLDAGKPYFLSDTTGAISTSVGTQEKMIGIAISATQIWIAPWAYLGLTQKTQTITGTKTFGSIPVLPASNPTTANQSTRKAYVDTKVSKAANGTLTLSASGTTTLTPGFRIISVRINGVLCVSSSNIGVGKVPYSNGGYALSSNTNGCVYATQDDNGRIGAGGKSSAHAYYVRGNGASYVQSGVVNNITATKFDIVNTKVGGGPGIYLFWEAIGY